MKILQSLKTIINKLPFNKLAEKVPGLSKFASFANYAFCSCIIIVILLLLVVPSPQKNPIVGTWSLSYNGICSKVIYIDPATDNYAKGIYTFYKNGDFYSLDVSKYKKTDGIILKDGRFAPYVSKFKERNGTWRFEDNKLIIKYDDGKEWIYNENDYYFNKKNKSLRLGENLFFKEY